MGIEHTYYNGNHATDFVTPRGLTKLSIDRLPPIVSRGVLQGGGGCLSNLAVLGGDAAIICASATSLRCRCIAPGSSIHERPPKLNRSDVPHVDCRRIARVGSLSGPLLTFAAKEMRDWRGAESGGLAACAGGGGRVPYRLP